MNYVYIAEDFRWSIWYRRRANIRQPVGYTTTAVTDNYGSIVTNSYI